MDRIKGNMFLDVSGFLNGIFGALLQFLMTYIRWSHILSKLPFRAFTLFTESAIQRILVLTTSLIALIVGLGLLGWLFIVRPQQHLNPQPAFVSRSPACCRRILAGPGYDNSENRSRLTPISPGHCSTKDLSGCSVYTADE